MDIERDLIRKQETAKDILAQNSNLQAISKLRDELGIPTTGVSTNHGWKLHHLTSEYGKAPFDLQRIGEIRILASKIVQDANLVDPTVKADIIHMIELFIVFGSIDPTLQLKAEGRRDIRLRIDNPASFPFSFEFTPDVGQEELLRYIRENWAVVKIHQARLHPGAKRIRAKTKREIYDYIYDNYDGDWQNMYDALESEFGKEAAKKYGAPERIHDIKSEVRKRRKET